MNNDAFDKNHLRSTGATVNEPKLGDGQCKRPFPAPKLSFVSPKVTKQGKLTQLTTGLGSVGDDG